MIKVNIVSDFLRALSKVVEGKYNSLELSESDCKQLYKALTYVKPNPPERRRKRLEPSIAHKAIKHLREEKAEKIKKKTDKNNPELKVIKKKKKQNYKQKRASQVHKDELQTAKQDMINHIQDLIDNREIRISEFINDPSIYYDKQIMREHYNNPIIRKSIEKYFNDKAFAETVF